MLHHLLYPEFWKLVVPSSSRSGLECPVAPIPALCICLHLLVALPGISAMHKSLQAIRLAALSHLRDPIVCEHASRHIAKHQHHGPAETVHDVLCNHLTASKSQTKAAVKKKIDESKKVARSDNISNLEVQGCFWCQGCAGSDTLYYWSEAVWALPLHIMSFALNATQDTLPHNFNLVHWKRNVSPQCRLCGHLQTLRHVLNACGPQR